MCLICSSVCFLATSNINSSLQVVICEEYLVQNIIYSNFYYFLQIGYLGTYLYILHERNTKSNSLNNFLLIIVCNTKFKLLPAGHEMSVLHFVCDSINFEAKRNFDCIFSYNLFSLDDASTDAIISNSLQNLCKLHVISIYLLLMETLLFILKFVLPLLCIFDIDNIIYIN